MSFVIIHVRLPTSAQTAQTKIARRFNAGDKQQNEFKAPEGRLKKIARKLWSSLWDFKSLSVQNPALKRRAIFNRRVAAETASSFFIPHFSF